MDVNVPEVVAEAREQFLRYEAALMANDVATLTDLFWSGALVVRYGIGENLYGDEEIARFRHQPDAAAEPRDLERVVITTFDRDFATTCAEFRRPASGQVGRQTQSWVRTGDGFKIVAAHVSMLDR